MGRCVWCQMYGVNTKIDTLVFMPFMCLGFVKPHSGVNLDEVKWATLVSHFGKIKAVLKGENVSLKGLKRPHDADDGVTVYQADWFLNGAIVESDNPSTDFYSYEKAVQDAEM